jgi:hypothetical protein
MATTMIVKKPVAGGGPLALAAQKAMESIKRVADVIPGLVDTAHAIWTVWQLSGRPAQIDRAVDQWISSVRNLKEAKQHNSASRGYASKNWSGGSYEAFIGHMDRNESITNLTMSKVAEIGQSLVDASHKATVDYHWALNQVVHAAGKLAEKVLNATTVAQNEEDKEAASKIIVEAATAIADRHVALANAMAEQKARMQKLGFTAAEVERPNSIPIGSTRRAGWEPKTSAKFSDLKKAGDRLLESSGEWGKAADNAWWAGRIPDDSLGVAGREVVSIYTRVSTATARELATGCEKVAHSATSLWVVSKTYKNAEEENADKSRLVWQAHDTVMGWRGHNPQDKQWRDADAWW